MLILGIPYNDLLFLHKTLCVNFFAPWSFFKRRILCQPQNAGIRMPIKNDFLFFNFFEKKMIIGNVISLTI